MPAQAAYELAALAMAGGTVLVARRGSLPVWLSPVLVAYAAGLCLAVTLGPPVALAAFAKTATGLTVLVAIAALLLGAQVGRLRALAGVGLRAAGALWIGAAVATLTLLLIDVALQPTALTLAIFTGGLVNLQAAGQAIGIPAAELGAANLGDVVAGGLLFLALLGPLWPLVARSLPEPMVRVQLGDASTPAAPPQPSTGATIVALSLTATSVIVGLGLAYAAVGAADEVLVLLGVSAAAVACAQLLAGREDADALVHAGTIVGDLAVLAFCVLIGWQSELREVGPAAVGWALTMGAFLAVQLGVALALARSWGVGAGAFLLAVAGCVYSPAFVPAFAQRVGRPDLAPLGIAVGLLGLLAATPLALAVVRVLGG